MSDSKLYVGNLSFQTNDDQLNQLFAEFGAVQSANVITDRDTGRSRGFGFVQMGTAAAANAAIQQLNGQMVDGRALTVTIAKPREGGGGGGGGRGRGNGGGW